MKTCLSLSLVLLMLTGCSPGQGDGASMTVFCGAANRPAMEEIAALFEKETGVAVKLLYGGSGSLLSQIELSRSGEIYLPGSPDFIIKAERRGQIFEKSDRVVAYLVPAIVTPKGNPAKIRTLEDLARPGIRVGIGNPETVCLGLYGVEIFEANGLLDGVLDNVVTFGASCSKTANLAAMGQVDAILGWRVFHFWNPEQMDVVPIAGDQIPRISYVPISIPVYTRDRGLSERFIAFTLSERGLAVYKKHGYIIDLGEAKALAPGAELGGEYALPEDYMERIKAVWERP